MINDIHTHLLARCANAIVNIEPQSFPLEKNCYYSVGIHPWKSTSINQNEIELLNATAHQANVVAIGETGIDKLRGGSLDSQIELFRIHVSLSEYLKKPLIIHAVRSYNEILKIKKEIKPSQTWIIHGFRGNPRIAKQLIDANIKLSYGENYNLESLKLTPISSIFVETDQSTTPINDIYTKIANDRGSDPILFEQAIQKNIRQTFTSIQ